MKVLIINGSPHQYGCTYTALQEVAKALNEDGVETEIYFLGNRPFQSCTACGGCRKNDPARCVFDDQVNEILDKADQIDGLIIGSPVHYAAASGIITAFMDRLFYVNSAFSFKPGAAVVSCRRGGNLTAFDQLNKYFTINNMPVVSSSYWNIVYGNTPEEVMKDLEGLQTMRNLGHNMAWMLKVIASGKAQGLIHPNPEKQFRTNFIR